MSVFNTEKTAEQYTTTRPFLNPEPGLVDTINKQYPRIWDLYKMMRGYDWSEDDITHESALKDFQTAPKDVCEMMLKTLMWQWEADSIASRAMTTIIAPFNPAMESVFRTTSKSTPTRILKSSELACHSRQQS